MSSARDRAALVALLRAGRRPWREYVEAVEQAGSALPALTDELMITDGQVSLCSTGRPPRSKAGSARVFVC